tara:strand:- start:1115 stop:1369 length:255 start_codon:yes stop_codon:yes gene_type:complete
MKKITIYTGPVCNYCDAAKKLLKRNSLKFNEIDISSGPEVLNEMITRTSGKRTIPQIFFDNEHIGGYVEIRELEKNKKLIEFLK